MYFYYNLFFIKISWLPTENCQKKYNKILSNIFDGNSSKILFPRSTVGKIYYKILLNIFDSYPSKYLFRRKPAGKIV